jgi:hypothetical protein
MPRGEEERELAKPHETMRRPIAMGERLEVLEV